MIAANHDTLWKRLAALMGHAEWGDDPRFADHTARGEHQALLDELIGEWAAQHTAAELDEIVNAAGVVCAPVYTAADIHGDPWFRERGLVVEWEDEVHGTIAGNGVVPKLMGTPGGVRHGARWTVGADNDDVLGELGLSAAEIAELRETGIEHRHANEGRLMAFRLGVDVGGTFTDLFLVNDADDRQFRVKTPSTPADPSLGVLTGVKRICAEAGISPSELRNIVHGTTVATNAVLESKGARVGLITTTGFKQILHLARSQTPGPLAGWIIMIKPDPPALLSDTREAIERLDARGNVVTPSTASRSRASSATSSTPASSRSPSASINSYVNSAHEEEIGAIVEELYPGFPVTLSSHVLPEFREYERTLTACMNSYVRPKVADYVKGLQSSLKDLGTTCDVNILRSDAGLMTTTEAQRNPIYGVLSGPSGGVAGALHVATKAGYPNILTFDMGGTSTDVALCQNGEPTIGRETSISHFRIKIPSVNVHTVGAGGGSIAHVPQLTGALRVGPQSAGAEPGPAAYGKGGEEPTVTDANVVVGHLPPRLLGGEMTLDVEGARAAVQKIADAMNLSLEQAADGILSIVNENMAGALRLVSVQRGHDPRDFALVAFGGAGPLHANAVAKLMGSYPVIVPPSPGLLCAIGDLVADFRNEFARTLIRLVREAPADEVAGILEELGGRARDVDGLRGHRGRRPAAQLRRRHALPRPGLRDPGRARRRGGAVGGPRRSRGALQRAARAALRLPHARDGERDRQPARDRQRLGAEARAADRRDGRRGSVRRRRRGARDPVRGRERADAHLRPLEAEPGSPHPGPGGHHGVRLDHGGAARLHGRGRHPLQPPHQPRGVSMAATEELRIAAIPTDVEIDPVTLDIIEGALKSARYEMDAVLFRSAMSPVIREQHDEFPMLTDPRGRMVVGQFGAYINEMMEEWTRGIYPGDVILCADPFKCSASISHTNDWLVLVPIFFEDELVGWASQFGHMMDAGGPLPGRAADRRQDDLRRGHHHPADQGRRARRRAGGRARADPQQRAHPGDEPGRPVRDHRRLPRRRGARDGALQPLRQAHLPRRPAGAARPHVRGDAAS